MEMPDFLNRSSVLLGDEGYEWLNNSTVSIAGLGGVGGLAFLTLVRSGVKKFRLAENGIFDPPDMNRQALAFNQTMDKRKLDVYIRYALDINPQLEIVDYPDGITLDNIDEIMDGCDVFMRAVDKEAPQDVKEKSADLIDKYNVPMFQVFTTGPSALMYNSEPRGMKPEHFWNHLLVNYSKVTQYLGTPLMRERVDQVFDTGTLSSLAVGANIASLLIASEILLYILRDTDLVDRSVVYTPKFTVLNPFDMKMTTLDVTQL